MYVFHGGCTGCTRQDSEGLGGCVGCCYLEADWNLPSKNLSELERSQERKRMVQQAKKEAKKVYYLKRFSLTVSRL